jgi:hypothetical protein
VGAFTLKTNREEKFWQEEERFNGGAGESIPPGFLGEIIQ